MAKLNRRIDEITIDMPCPVSWDSMTGDNKIRFCDICELNVHNLAYFTEAEIEEFLFNNVGQRKCVSLMRRPDGTIVTDRCPAALRKLRDKGLFYWQAFVGLVTFFVGMTQCWAQGTQARLTVDGTQSSLKLTVGESNETPISQEEWAAAIADLKAGHFLDARLKFSSFCHRDRSMRAEYFIGLCQKSERQYSSARATLTRVSTQSPDYDIRRKSIVALNSIVVPDTNSRYLNDTVYSGNAVYISDPSGRSGAVNGAVGGFVDVRGPRISAFEFEEMPPLKHEPPLRVKRDDRESVDAK